MSKRWEDYTQKAEMINRTNLLGNEDEKQAGSYELYISQAILQDIPIVLYKFNQKHSMMARDLLSLLNHR